MAGRDFPNEWAPEDRDGEDPTFTLAEEDTIESVVADYRLQIAGSKDILGSLDLETPCAVPDQAHNELRWVALHMIEETARHAGHADIIRESIDGARGR